MKTLLAVALLALISPAAVRAAEAQPNVLFLFADDMRADTIAALGNPLIETPNLDRLVHRGVSFRRAYMQGGFNGATCVPSRAMLLSGQNLFHIDEKLLRSETWPEAYGARRLHHVRQRQMAQRRRVARAQFPDRALDVHGRDDEPDGGETARCRGRQSRRSAISRRSTPARPSPMRRSVS